VSETFATTGLLPGLAAELAALDGVRQRHAAPPDPARELIVDNFAGGGGRVCRRRGDPMSGPGVTILSTQDFTMHCAGRHQWTETWPVPCLLRDFLRRMAVAAKCPRCGEPSFLGPAPAPNPDTENASR